MELWGASVASAQLWANLLALATALLVAATALSPSALRWAPSLHVAAIPLFLLMAFNPPSLRQDVSPSWHGWTLFLVVFTTFLARHDWRSASWSRARGATIWGLLAISLYSVYLLPPIFVAGWGVADLAASSRGRERWRSLAFWLPLAVLPAAGGLFILLRHSGSAEMWGQLWLTPDVSRLPQVFVALFLGTNLLLPALALLRRDERLRQLPLHLFTLVLLALFLLVMNRAVPERAVFVERLVIYLLPGTLLAAGALARRSWLARGALLAAAGLLLAGTVSRPDLTYRWMARAAPRVPWEMGFGKAGAAAVAAADPTGKTPLLFGHSGHAAMVLAQHRGPRPVAVYPAAAYLEAVEGRRERAFLERRAPALRRPPEQLLLLARPRELASLLEAVPPVFAVERLPPGPGFSAQAVSAVRLVRQAGHAGPRSEE
jgi:hypothetical protein